MKASATVGGRVIGREGVSVAYERRSLAGWSDARLVDAVASVIAEPRRDAADSFVLHAPLELGARVALLPHVLPRYRDAARRRIVSLASKYEGYVPLTATLADDHDSNRELDPEDRIRLLVDAISRSDLDGAERVASAIVTTMHRADIVSSLAGTITPLTSAAAHGSIFLHYLASRDVLSLAPNLLRPLVRELARNPARRIRWTENWTPNRTTDPHQLAAALSRTPHLGAPAIASIHRIVMQVDASGVADQLLRPVLGKRTDVASHEVLRVAARSMLLDDPDHAPFGWSHCLTIPQAILAVSRATPHGDVGLALAATHVAAFRAALGAMDLPDEPRMTLPNVDVATLVSRACVFEEAHISKYVLACLDAAHDDPEAQPLYLAAAQRLVDLWSERLL